MCMGVHVIIHIWKSGAGSLLPPCGPQGLSPLASVFYPLSISPALILFFRIILFLARPSVFECGTVIQVFIDIVNSLNFINFLIALYITFGFENLAVIVPIPFSFK